MAGARRSWQVQWPRLEFCILFCLLCVSAGLWQPWLGGPFLSHSWPGAPTWCRRWRSGQLLGARQGIGAAPAA